MAAVEIEMSFDAETGSTAVHTEAQELGINETPVIHENSFEPDMNPYKVHGTFDDDASIPTSNEDDHVLPIGDLEGNPVHYPGEDKDEHHHKVRQSTRAIHLAHSHTQTSRTHQSTNLSLNCPLNMRRGTD